jgi:carbamoyltransferase
MNFQEESVMTWELESIFSCSYPDIFKTEYKHQGSRGPHIGARMTIPSDREGEDGSHELVIDDTGGIVKAYEAVTQYCGWAPIEAGKTMGLAPYGNPNKDIPKIYDDAGGGVWRTTNRNLIIPTFPNGAAIAETRFQFLNTLDQDYENNVDLTVRQNRRDLAYAVQSESQQEVLNLIYDAVERTGNNNVVLSGGYGLNCVANYWYLDKLAEKNINLYVEPVSNDAGTAIGAALLIYYSLTKNQSIRPYADSLYLGPEYNYNEQEIDKIVSRYDGKIREASNKDVVNLLQNKNIVAIFQGRSEAGPRALGNRSLLFDPRFNDGKEFVNQIKHREYFRPFAATILWDYVHDWFDIKQLNESPHMMYAVNCMPGIEEKIPSVVHVDGTCRIQTLKYNQNILYYELINEFFNITNVPLLFNTSFNLGGEPLVETLDDAVRTLYTSELEYLYLPEYSILIEVKN